LDASKLNFATQVDPAVANGNITDKIRPDLNAGLYLYSSDYFIGLSAQQIIPGKVEFADNIVRETEGRQVPHLFATAGYRFLISEDLNLTPSVLVKYISPVKPQVDINAKLQFRDLLWAGGSYRSQDGFAGMVGLNISNTLNVGYSYDYTTSRLNNFSKGTHEVIVGFLIGNRYGDTCPRNVR
jgi:type IX secretion system PorP/SprF family membrane protein